MAIKLPFLLSSESQSAGTSQPQVFHCSADMHRESKDAVNSIFLPHNAVVMCSDTMVIAPVYYCRQTIIVCMEIRLSNGSPVQLQSPRNVKVQHPENMALYLEAT